LKNKLLGTKILLFFLLFFMYNLQATNSRAGLYSDRTVFIICVKDSTKILLT
jgi:hypothetical protein